MNEKKTALRGTAMVALLTILACNIYAEHSGRYLVSIPVKLAFAGILAALWTLISFLGAPRGVEYRRKNRRYLTGLLLYYSWILCNMLFFDASFGRAHSELLPQVNFYAADVNLVPLKTIHNYLRAYERGNISGSIVAVNLLGNLLAFAPMGFFLPTLCRPLRNFFLFTLSTGAMICAVEVLQILTRTGSCDIDDFILNLAGALLVWLVMQLPPIRRRVYDVLPSRKRGK